MSALARFLRDTYLSLAYALYRLRFRLQPACLRGACTLGGPVKFNVPVRCDGNGTVEIGRKVRFGYALAPRMGSGEVLIQARAKGARISIGDATILSNNVSVIANTGVVIGENCLIGDLCMIADSDFHDIDPATRRSGAGATAPISIGSNVWLGSRVIVQKGVTIGDNSVVAAQSVVTGDIPANSVAAGVPARVIRTI